MIDLIEAQVRINSEFKGIKSTRLANYNIIVDKSNYKKHLVNIFLILKRIFGTRQTGILNFRGFGCYLYKRVNITLKFLLNKNYRAKFEFGLILNPENRRVEFYEENIEVKNCFRLRREKNKVLAELCREYLCEVWPKFEQFRKKFKGTPFEELEYVLKFNKDDLEKQEISGLSLHKSLIQADFIFKSLRINKNYAIVVLNFKSGRIALILPRINEYNLLELAIFEFLNFINEMEIPKSITYKNLTKKNSKILIIGEIDRYIDDEEILKNLLKMLSKNAKFVLITASRSINAGKEWNIIKIS